MAVVRTLVLLLLNPSLPAVKMHRCSLLLVIVVVLSALAVSSAYAYAPPASIPSFPLYNAAVPGLTTPAIGVGFGGSDTHRQRERRHCITSLSAALTSAESVLLSLCQLCFQPGGGVRRLP